MNFLRGVARTSHIPIVAISANVIPTDIKKGLDAGFFRYLTKPIVVSEFMDALRVALDFAATGAGNGATKGTLQ